MRPGGHQYPGVREAGLGPTVEISDAGVLPVGLLGLGPVLVEQFPFDRRNAFSKISALTGSKTKVTSVIPS